MIKLSRFTSAAHIRAGRGGTVNYADLKQHVLSLDATAGELLLLFNRTEGKSYKSAVGGID